MCDQALWGLGGQLVRAIAPHTEAAEAALFSQLLTAFGNCIGRSPHFIAEADRHGSNLFVINVGSTSKGRKGSSWGQIQRLFSLADPLWLKNNVRTGLSSGEGALSAIRDKGTTLDDVGLGTDDKRMLALEQEFGSTLKVLGREGNILSPVLRNAWDGKDLATMTRKDPLKVTDPHVSIIAHITKNELLKLLNEGEIANGLANRFLFFWVARSKILPDGGNLDADDLNLMIQELKASIDFGKDCGPVSRDPEARELWHSVYEQISDDRPGLAGTLLARYEAQVMRIALVQAVLNRKSVITAQALQSALKIMEFCDRSVRHVFGDATGDSFADLIFEKLQETPKGLTRTEIRDLGSRNYRSHSVERSLRHLQDNRMAICRKNPTQGRSSETWISVKYANTYDKNDQSPLMSFRSYQSEQSHVGT